MYTDILRRISGIEVFPVISLLLFVTVFTVALIWTVRLDPDRVSRLSRMPLDPPTGGDDAPLDSPAFDRTRSRS